jgi:hypothetical protein
MPARDDRSHGDNDLAMFYGGFFRLIAKMGD